ncbi:DUF1642 domain-containing protein [Lacticaseibacillus paracasei]|jgi:hypothetical protein|uniref:DUF1642 domain-containing protein n=1 Tax=Lacticaseibacillus paracasei TaxID=1597 RepID=UPI002359C562|nr:DUF1642 domain-containing protein [Lacticaseibacillus paracasei]WCZ20001.1 DUF1642 domain-containing protein [Lacticaseibacillus paracasei]
MSEEKLYAVRNDEGKWADAGYYFGTCAWATPDKDDREKVAKHHGSHVVTLVEEPEKEAVSESVGGAIDSLINADTYVQAAAAFQYLFASRKKKDIKRIMKAIRNGYTVAKEKKYVVYKNLGGKHNTDVQYAQAYRSSAHSETFSWTITSWILNDEDTNGSSFQFTEAEIEHYGLQDCEKEEVTDDEQ